MYRYNVHQDPIGEGAFGVVYYAEKKSNGAKRALKRIKGDVTWEKVQAMRELRALIKLPAHNNIVKLYEVLVEDQTVHFVFDFIPDGSLRETLQYRLDKGMPSLPVGAIRSIIWQILKGIDHMHKNGIFHRDLKPDNILLDGRRVLVADFSMARGLEEDCAVTSYVSTRWYRAPEIMLISKRYSSPVDIFAIGCIGAELFTQNPLFPGSNELNQLYRIFSVVGSPIFARWNEGTELLGQYYRAIDWSESTTQPTLRIPGVEDSTAHHFLMAMLRLDPARRLTAVEALAHDYLAPLRNQVPRPPAVSSPAAVTLSPASAAIRNPHV